MWLMYQWQFGISTALETLNIQAYRVHAISKAWNSNLQSSSLSLSLSLLRLFFSFSHVGKWVKYSFLWANTLKFQKKLVNSQCGLFLPLRLSSCSIACSVISNTMFDLSLLLTSSCVTLCFRIILCWVLVLKSGLAKLGAALSVSLSYWTHALLLG